MRVELAEDGGLVDRRPALGRDQERAEGEIDVRLRARDEAREPGAAGRSAVVDAGSRRSSTAGF